MDIIKALEDRASALRIELDKIQCAIQAITGTKTVTRSPARTFRHTESTKRKLRAAQQKIWAARGSKTGTEPVARQRKWHHTPATKRKLRLAQQTIWAAKRKK